MNVTVKDIEILQSIQPQQVATYLQNHGWHQPNRSQKLRGFKAA